MIYKQTENYTLYSGDVFEEIKNILDKSVNCITTSPPYWMQRNYKAENEFGQEPSFLSYVDKSLILFSHFKRILKDDGVIFYNIYDSYSGNNSNQGSGQLGSKQSKGINSLRDKNIKKEKIIQQKSLCGIPWRIALRVIDELNMVLRSDIIWNKIGGMPESVTDRPTKSFEYLFMFSKTPKYTSDFGSIRTPNHRSTIERAKSKWSTKDAKAHGYVKQNGLNREGIMPLSENGANIRNVWDIVLADYLPDGKNEDEQHFAKFPRELARKCIVAGCPQTDGVVLDPFMGSGTTLVEGLNLGKKVIGIDSNKHSVKLAYDNIKSFTEEVFR